MMDVPIGDQDFRDSMAPLSVTRGNADIVEDTEAHAAIGHGMVSRRPKHAESVARPLFGYLVDGVQNASGRFKSDIERLAANLSISGPQHLGPGADVLFHGLDIGPGVAECQLVFGRLAARQTPYFLIETRRLDGIHDGVKPLGPFRVAASGGVELRDRIGKQSGRPRDRSG